MSSFDDIADLLPGAGKPTPAAPAAPAAPTGVDEDPNVRRARERGSPPGFPVETVSERHERARRAHEVKLMEKAAPEPGMTQEGLDALDREIAGDERDARKRGIALTGRAIDTARGAVPMASAAADGLDLIGKYGRSSAPAQPTEGPVDASPEEVYRAQRPARAVMTRGGQTQLVESRPPAPGKPTAPLMESLEAGPGIAVAGTAKAFADTLRALWDVDARIAELEKPNPNPGGVLPPGAVNFRPETRAKIEAAAEQRRQNTLADLRAERERLSAIANSSEQEIKDLTPKDQGTGGKIITSVFGSGPQTLAGVGVGFLTRNPVMGAAVMGLPVYGNSVAETNEAGNEARQRQTDLAAMTDPAQKIDYVTKLLSGREAGAPFQRGAGELVHELSKINSALEEGRITNDAAQKQVDVALRAFGNLVDHVAKNATTTTAKVRGVFDTIAEVAGERIPLGIALKQGMGAFEKVIKTAAAEFGQEFATQFAQSLSEKATTDPNKTAEQVLEEMLVAGGAGVVMGTAFGSAGAAIDASYVAKAKADAEKARALIERLRAYPRAGQASQGDVRKSEPAEPPPAASSGPAAPAAAPAQATATAAPAFTPTHRLEDGTPVTPHSEDGVPVAGVWRTEDGRLAEAPRATPMGQVTPNAEWTVNDIPYDVQVVGKGRGENTARLADGQEIPIRDLTNLDDEAKALLGLVPPEEEKAAPPARKEPAAAPAAAPEPKAQPQAESGTSSPEPVPAAAAGAPEAKPEPKPAPAKPVKNEPPPKLEGTRNLQMQNRMREGAASIQQMNQIAEAPDYERLSFSKAPESGAPMVSMAGNVNNTVPEDQIGRQSLVVIGGQRVPVRYAVVEATDLLASHYSDGRVRKEYFDDPQPGQLRALNNGRAAGLRDAYLRDTAKEYRDALQMDFDGHGIDANIIQRMKKPVLVRLYDDSYNTSIANIGQASQGETLKQSPTEVALQDSGKITDTAMQAFEPGESGQIAAPSNDKFISWFMSKVVTPAELGELIDPQTKKPNQRLYDRIEAAIFQKAYGSKDLTGMFAEAADPEIRAVLNALSIAAPEMAKLEGSPPLLDIRPYVAEAAKVLLAAKRANAKLTTFLKQQDIEGRHPLVQEMAEFMAANVSAPRKMGEGFKAGARWVQQVIADEATADIFGDRPTYTANDALTSINKFMEVEYGQAKSGPAEPAGKSEAGGTAAQEPRARQPGGRYEVGGRDENGGVEAPQRAEDSTQGAEAGSGAVRPEAGPEVEGIRVYRGRYAGKAYDVMSGVTDADERLELLHAWDKNAEFDSGNPKIIYIYPGEGGRFAVRKGLSKVRVPLQDFITWLMSPDALDTKYGDSDEWNDLLGRARDAIEKMDAPVIAPEAVAERIEHSTRVRALALDLLSEPTEGEAKTADDVRWNEQLDYYSAWINNRRALIWKRNGESDDPRYARPTPFLAIVAGSSGQLRNGGHAETLEEAKQIAFEGHKLAPILNSKEGGAADHHGTMGEYRMPKAKRVAKDYEKPGEVRSVPLGEYNVEQPRAEYEVNALRSYIANLDHIIAVYTRLGAKEQAAIMARVQQDYRDLLANPEGVFYAPKETPVRGWMDALQRNIALHAAGLKMESTFRADNPHETLYSESWKNRMRQKYGAKAEEKMVEVAREVHDAQMGRWRQGDSFTRAGRDWLVEQRRAKYGPSDEEKLNSLMERAAKGGKFKDLRWRIELPGEGIYKIRKPAVIIENIEAATPRTGAGSALLKEIYDAGGIVIPEELDEESYPFWSRMEKDGLAEGNFFLDDDMEKELEAKLAANGPKSKKGPAAKRQKEAEAAEHWAKKAAEYRKTFKAGDTVQINAAIANLAPEERKDGVSTAYVSGAFGKIESVGDDGFRVRTYLYGTDREVTLLLTDAHEFGKVTHVAHAGNKDFSYESWRDAMVGFRREQIERPKAPKKAVEKSIKAAKGDGTGVLHEYSVHANRATDRVKRIAHGIRSNDAAAIAVAAKEMAKLVRREDILIPMPGRAAGAESGTWHLAQEISQLTGAPVIGDALRTYKARESQYELKKKGLPPLSGRSLNMGWAGNKLVDSGNFRVWIVDNVIDTGATMERARQLLPNAKPLVWAQVTYDAKNESPDGAPKSLTPLPGDRPEFALGEQKTADKPVHTPMTGPDAPLLTPPPGTAPARSVDDNPTPTDQLRLFQRGAAYETVDAAAAEAAGHEATEAQQEAGNYPKGHVLIGPRAEWTAPGADGKRRFVGGQLEVAIENQAGTSRRPEWPPLKDHYGYIKGSVGYDKDHLDVFIKPGTPTTWGGPVWVINQLKAGNPGADGRPTYFDEHKAMIGFASRADAEQAYLSNYEQGWDMWEEGAVEMSWSAFRAWALSDSPRTGPRSGKLDLETAQLYEKRVSDEISEAARKDSDPREAAAQLNLFAAPTLPGTSVRIPQRFTVEVVRTGSVMLPRGKIETAEDAAAAFAQLNDYPRERFQMIGLDKNRRPIAFYDLFAGTLSQTSVFPREVWTNLYMTPGVTSVWLGHNHPSGLARPSRADEMLTRTLSEFLDERIGVRYAGHVIVAGATAVHLDSGRSFSMAAPSGQSMKAVPVMERKIVRQEFKAGEELTSPGLARDFIRGLNAKEAGLLLLDSQHRVSGWWPLDMANLDYLKGGDGIRAILPRLIRMLGETNAAAAMMYVPAGSDLQAAERVARSLKEVLSKADMRLLDAFVDNSAPGMPAMTRLVSLAEQGVMEEGATYELPRTNFSLRNRPEDATAEQRAVSRLLDRLERAERTVDALYARGDPRAEEADAKLAPLKEQVADMVAEMEEAEAEPVEMAGLEENLRQAYQRLLSPAYRSGMSTADIYDNMRAAVEEAGGKPGTDRQLRAAARDAYMAAANRRARVRASYRMPLRVDGQNVETVQRELADNELARALGARVRVVQNASELPEHMIADLILVGGMSRVQGAWDASGGVAYLVAGNIAPGQAEKVLLHEAVGHHGIEQVLGNQFEPVMREIYLARRGQIAQEATNGFLRAYKLDLRKAAHQTYAASEWIAHMAERGMEPTLWQKVVGAIRAALRKMGFVRDWTDADILHLFQLSRSALLNGGTTTYNAQPMWAISGPSPIWYSALARGIEAKGPGRAMPADWLKFIDAMPGVKAEEIEWAGLREWLGTQVGRPSKQAVLEYLAANGVQVDEVRLGEPSQTMPEHEREADNERRMLVDELNDLIVRMDSVGYTAVFSTEEELEGFKRREDGTIFMGREFTEQERATALRLGDGAIQPRSAFEPVNAHRMSPIDVEREKRNRWFDRAMEISRMSIFDTPHGWARVEPAERETKYGQSKYVLPGGTDQREIILYSPQALMWPGDDNPHFGDLTNRRTIAWIRANTRTTPDGKRIFFLEEVQSRRGQAGRKMGFLTKEQTERAKWLEYNIDRIRNYGLNDEERAAYFTPGRIVKSYAGYDQVISYDPGASGAGWGWSVKVQAMRMIRDRTWGNQARANARPTREEMADLSLWEVDPHHSGTRHHTTDPSDHLVAEWEAERRELGNSPPDTPFTRSTETWARLAIKRAIRYAIDNGFDGIAWTTGKQQNERYNLSSHIRALSYHQSGDEYSLHVMPVGRNKEWKRIGVFYASELPGVVGEGLARKIIAGEGEAMGPGTPRKMISDLNVEVGGTGMVEFYDNMLPNIVNDVVKKIGGGRVAQMKFEGGAMGLPPNRENLDLAARQGREDVYVRHEATIERPMAMGRAQVIGLKSNKIYFDGPYDEAVKVADRVRMPIIEQPGLLFTTEMRQHAGAPMPMFSLGFQQAQPATGAAEPEAEYGKPNWSLEPVSSVSLAHDERGRPLLGDSMFAIVEPQKLGVTLPGGDAYQHKIFVGRRQVGVVILQWEGRLGAYSAARTLLYIRTFKDMRGLGIGEGVIQLLLQHNGGAGLHAVHVLPEARGFWENMGAEFVETETGEDGFLTPERYTDAQAARAAARQGGSGSGQAGAGVGASQREGGEGPGNAAGVEGDAPLGRTRFSLRDGGQALTEVYGVRDGRVQGMATRSYSNGPWEVYIAASQGFNRSARREQAGSLNEVARIFAREGLEFRATKPANTPVPDRAIFDRDWVAPQADNWLKRSIIYFQNRLLLPELYERTIEREVGDIPESAKAHREARLAHPRAAGKIADFDHDHTERIIALMRTHGLTLKDVGLYLYARHAPERNAAIESIRPGVTAGSGMSNERAAALMAELEARPGMREIGAIASEVNAFREDTLINKGLAKRETVEMLRQKYRNYVPLKEMVEDEFTQSEVSGGYQVGRILNTAFGRFTEAQAEYILPALIAQAKGTIAAGENAEVLRNLLRLVSYAPNPAVWRIQSVVWKPYLDADTGEVRYAPRPVQIDANYGSKAISVPVNGERTIIVVEDQRLADAYKRSGLNVGEFSQLIGSVTRFYALMATAANPEFIAVNLMRDFQQAMLRISGEQNPKLAAKVARDMLPALWGAFQGLNANGQLTEGAGEWHRWYRRYIEAGGHIAYRGMNDAETQHKDFLTQLAEAGIYPEAATGLQRARLLGHRAAKRFGGKWFSDLVINANGAVENALRLSAFKNAVEAGWTEKDAAMLARTVTVDFNLKGEAGSRIGAYYMFFNANIQGSALLLRSIINHKAVQALVVLLFMMGAGMDWWNRRHSNRGLDGRAAYDNITNSIKEKNLVIMAPGGENAITIPLPFGFNTFYVAGANLMATIDGPKKASEAAVDTLVAAVNAFNPMGQTPSSSLGFLQLIAPTFADPIVQAMTNRNFMDKPIKPERPRFATPQAEASTYFPGTPQAYVDASDYLNRATGGNAVRSGWADISPNMMQHWVRSIFGSAGGFYSRIGEYVHSKAKGEDVETRNIPFLRRLYYEPKDFELSHRFYENLNHAEVAHWEVRRAMEAGDREGAATMKGEFEGPRRMFAEAQAAEKQVSQLRQEISRLRKDPRIGDDQRKMAIEKLEASTRDVMMRFNARFEQNAER